MKQTTGFFAMAWIAFFIAVSVRAQPAVAQDLITEKPNLANAAHQTAAQTVSSPSPASPKETEARYPISKTDFEHSLAEIEKLAADDKTWPEAKTRYSTLLQHDLTPPERMTVRSALDALNIKILFSPMLTPDSFFYTVESGDSLYEIAKKNHTTIELIKASNRLKSDEIRAGKKLKITKAKYSITVSKTKNILQLYSDGELFKTYPVATGREGSTPTGTFTIENKITNPTWYKTGAVFPPGSPDNILGTRWLGFSLEHYGIHGTTLPKTIGQQASDGCVRMFNKDVEELYTIVPLKTQVTVTE